MTKIKTDNTFKTDGWSNIVLNTKSKKSKSDDYNYSPNTRLSMMEQDAVYDGDAIAANICDLPAQDMTKEGITINHENAKELEKEYNRLSIWSELKKALSYESAFGGAAVILDIDDGEDDWAIPLNINKIKSINDVFAVDRYFLTPAFQSSIKQPDLYTINNIDGRSQIHISRMLFFTGIDTGIRNRINNQGFGQSRIDRIIHELRNYGIGHNLIPNILIDFVTGIFKLQDLNKKIAAKQDTEVTKKLDYISMLMGAMNKIVLDAGDDFQNKSLNVNGIDKLIYMIERRLCAAAGIPHTKLLQESPGGGLTNNGGNSEQSQQWHDWIKSEQKESLSPKLNKLNRILATYLKINNPDDIPFVFNPLQQRKESEIVSNRKIVAETDKIYNEMSQGILAATLINSRYGEGDYSYETSLKPNDIKAIENKQKEIKLVVKPEKIVNPDLTANDTVNEIPLEPNPIETSNNIKLPIKNKLGGKQ